jgi:hypothetical protein
MRAADAAGYLLYDAQLATGSIRKSSGEVDEMAFQGE